MAFLVLVLIATVWLFRVMPKGFIPSEDRSLIYGLTEAAEGISWEAMKRQQQALAAIAKQDPNVEAFMSSAGARAGSITGSNSGVLVIRLKPRSERELSADEIIQGNCARSWPRSPGFGPFCKTRRPSRSAAG